MNKLNRNKTKTVVGAIVGIGCGAVVQALVDNHVKTDGKIERFSVKIGSWSLGILSGKASAEYAEEIVDAIFDLYEKYRKKPNYDESF